MTNKLNDKIIVITGGSGLIGRAIIESLIGHGACVINLDLHTSNEISGQVDFIECDICDYETSKNGRRGLQRTKHQSPHQKENYL